MQDIYEREYFCDLLLNDLHTMSYDNLLFGPLSSPALLKLPIPLPRALASGTPGALTVTPSWGTCQNWPGSFSLVDLITLTWSTRSFNLQANSGLNKEGATSSKLASSSSNGSSDLFKCVNTLDLRAWLICALTFPIRWVQGRSRRFGWSGFGRIGQLLLMAKTKFYFTQGK